MRLTKIIGMAIAGLAIGCSSCEKKEDSLNFRARVEFNGYICEREFYDYKIMGARCHDVRLNNGGEIIGGKHRTVFYNESTDREQVSAGYSFVYKDSKGKFWSSGLYGKCDNGTLRNSGIPESEFQKIKEICSLVEKCQKLMKDKFGIDPI